MGSTEAAGIIAPVPTHRRWVGVLLSLLIAGAGIFLAGNRKAGLRWFVGLTLLSCAAIALAPLPAIPGLVAFGALAAITLVLTLWMLVLSYKPIPRLGIRGWLLFLVLAGMLGALETLLSNWVWGAFKVPTGSMEPTIQPGDRVFVQTSAYWLNAPSRGDVVVFRTDALDTPGLPKDQFWAKRIVGLPGEALEITNGCLLINGLLLQRPPVLAGHNFSMPAAAFALGNTNAWVVPADSFFIVGDNATNSLDSRYFGAIPRRSIIGRATKIYWPLARAGDIR